MLTRDSLGRWDWLMGYQTARLSESLTIDSARNSGPQIELRDSFHVKNQFHGATFGFSGDVREGNWYFGGMFKLGLGNMQREVNIQGNQIVRIVECHSCHPPIALFSRRGIKPQQPLARKGEFRRCRNLHVRGVFGQNSVDIPLCIVKNMREPSVFQLKNLAWSLSRRQQSLQDVY